ncbi:MAG: radical SAM protein [Nitrospinae bacterium]|nr:radical SAM protein [Nitrospinota bacterium]
MENKEAQLRLVFWETTAGCNLECIHCRRLEVSHKLMESDLSTEESKRLIDRIRATGECILVLSGGEPLIRPDIFELARYAADVGLTVALATNGTMVTPEIAKKIKESGIQRVSVSLDGGDAATHDAFRKLTGSFDKAVRGIKNIQAEGVETQVNSTIAKHNIHQLEQIYDNAVNLGCMALHIFMLVPVGCGVEIEESQSLDAVSYERALNWFYDKSKEGKIQTKATCAPHYFRIMRQRAAQEGLEVTPKNYGMAAMTKGCLAGQSICFISHKGEVFPCGYFPLEVGNVRRTDFKEIWEKGEAFVKLRDVGNLTGKCGACDYKSVCEGCRARAYFYTGGDYLAEEPYCIYEPPGWAVKKAMEEMAP